MNCDDYMTKDSCRECSTGYQLVFTKEVQNYCYPVSENLKCSDLDDNAFREGKILCN